MSRNSDESKETGFSKTLEEKTLDLFNDCCFDISLIKMKGSQNQI